MSAPHVSLNDTCYLVPLNGTVHHVRRDGACTCGGTPQQPCLAIPLVRAYLAGGGQRPPGHDESTWPETWADAPASCPICDCPTLPDRYLNSQAGPGWRCSLAGSRHFWEVRINPLRRYLADHPPEPRYPWYGLPEPERLAWLGAYQHPPRLVSSRAEGSTVGCGAKLARGRSSTALLFPQTEDNLLPAELNRRAPALT
jgi:hypothetical protein